MHLHIGALAYLQHALGASSVTNTNSLHTGASASGKLRVADLIAGLGVQASQLGAARKALERLDAQAPTEAPLPAVVRDRVTRKAGYQEAKRDVSKWQSIVTVRGLTVQGVVLMCVAVHKTLSMCILSCYDVCIVCVYMCVCVSPVAQSTLIGQPGSTDTPV